MSGCDGSKLDMKPFEEMLKAGEGKEPAIFMMFSLMQEVSKLRSCVAQLEVTTAQHYCKWNGNIPALLEFQKNTTEVRENIYGRIDRSETDIDTLTKTVAENTEQIKSLTKALAEHIEEEKKAREKSKTYMKWLGGTLFISIITIIITNAEYILRMFGRS